jgi:hypothetical protein
MNMKHNTHRLSVIHYLINASLSAHPYFSGTTLPQYPCLSKLETSWMMPTNAFLVNVEEIALS